MSKKILMVASPGGHFVQLSLLAEGLGCHDIIVASTYSIKPGFMPGSHYENIPDFNRDSFYKVFPALWACLRILRKYQPDLVVSTGAAPGLVMVVAAKIKGVRAVWVDSLANSKKLSLSGTLVKRLGGIVLSQWENVAQEEGVQYKGRVV